MDETLDLISPILPTDFFEATIELYHTEKITTPLKKKHRLPDFSELLYEDHFADVACGWHRKGLVFDVDVKQPFEESFHPQFKRGDSVEIFIDTRDLKTAGFPTRFCHHFVIFPKPIEGVIAEEISTFRMVDKRPLCDRELISVKSECGKRNYHLHIFLPSECLHGYDPDSFDRLGLAYQINRCGKSSQHLATSSDYWNLESQPSLWSCAQMRDA